MTNMNDKVIDLWRKFDHVKLVAVLMTWRKKSLYKISKRFGYCIEKLLKT